MSYRDENPDFNPLPVLRTTIGDLLSRCLAGGLVLKIPQVRDQNSPKRGMHLHLLPELFLQVSGVNHFSYPHEEMDVGPGDICLVPRCMPHGESSRHYHGPFFMIVVMPGREQLSVLFSDDNGKGHPHTFAVESFHTDHISTVIQQMDQIVELFHHKSEKREIILAGLLQVLLGLLLHITDRDSEFSAEVPRKVSQCRQLVRAGLTNPQMSVRTLAESLRCAPDYLSHLFCKSTGITLSKFINCERISHASGLLSNTDLSVKEIAWASGFSDPGYFSRIFRRFSGVSPRGFRRLD